MLIKIYAKRIKAPTGQKIKSRGRWERYTCHGGMWAGEDGLILYTEGFDRRSKAAIDMILELAEEVHRRGDDVEVRIMDIMKNADGLRAVFDNVRTIPTVVVGERRFEGVPEKDELSLVFT